MKSRILILLSTVVVIFIWTSVAMSFCLAPDPVVSIENVNVTFDENSNFPVHITADIKNISSDERDIPFTVLIHGYVIANTRTGMLAPGEVYNYVYNGKREDYMWDGFKHRVVVRALQNDPFHRRNPARVDKILEIPLHNTPEVETEITKLEYKGDYWVDIETKIKNNTDRVMTPGWAVTIMGSINVHIVDHEELQPGETHTFSGTVNLAEHQDEFDVAAFGPFPVRVMSCAMGFCSADFFVADDLCNCVPEICNNQIDDDCNGLIDENCEPVDSVTKVFTKELQWQQMGHPGQFTHAQAVDYCRALDGSSGAWRLPTKDELKSLVVCSNGTVTPLEDGTTCGSHYRFPTISSEFRCSMSKYWTSTADGENYWTVNFYTGEAAPLSKDSTANVRCVRAAGF